MNTVKIVLASFTAICIAIVIGIVILTFFPKEIISYPKGTEWPVTNSPVTAGSYVHYNLYYCKYTEDISTVYHTLAGKNIYTLGNIKRNIPTGCHDVTITDVFIPDSVPAGKYRLHITVEYHPNPIRLKQYFLQTKEFEVIEATHSADQLP